MTNRFDNTSEGDQNVGQGEGAIGKQTNIFLPLKPRILVLVIVLLAGIGMGTYYLFAPPAKSLSTQGGNAPATVAGHDATVHYNIGLAPNLIAKSVEELGEKKQIIKGFLSMLLPEQVSQDQWDSKLREIAGHYKELRTLLETVEFEAPEVGAEIVRAVKAGNYVKVENLLNQAEARDVQAVEKLEQAAQQRRYSAALSCAVHALLQEEMQLGHAKAAEYWQKAAALVPEKDTKARSLCLYMAGYELYRIARYAEALPLYEQSLAISKEIGNRTREATTIWYIGLLYKDQGDLTEAEQYMSRAMEIAQEIGDSSSERWREELGLLRAGAGTSLNNLVKKAYAKGEYATALKYLEQLLTLYQKIGDWVGEGTTLNYFAATAYAEGEYATARNYLEQNLKLMRKIKARAEEAAISWNIGLIYKEQGDLTKAEQYISRAVQIAEEIGDSSSEGWRKDLEKLRVEIKSQ